MKERNFYVALLISFVVLVLSFSLNLRFLKSSVDHVVFEDVKTLRSVLVTSLQTVIRTQKEQEFYVVKNLLKAEEWLSDNPSYNLQNLKWLKEVTEISGILFLDANLNVVDAFPPNPKADSILLGFDKQVFSQQDLYPYENDYSVNLASRIGNRIAVFYVVRRDLMNRRLSVGTNELLNSLENDRKIAYLAIQDTQGVWFGVKVPEDISDIDEDPPLKKVFEGKKSYSRVVKVSGEEVLEISMPFELSGIYKGIIRLGISRSYYTSAYKGFVRNLALLHLLLFVLLYIALSLIYSRKRLQLKLSSFDTLLSNVPLGVAIFAKDDSLIFANEEFYRILRVSKQKARELKLSEILPDLPVLEVYVKKDTLKKLRYTAVPVLSNNNKRVATLLIVESTVFEEKVERAERIELLGEMSAQVAHEIKNPLNSISMIVQRLSSEFVIQPEIESRELLSILSRETEKIKEIVNRFVSIMAPLKINWECVDLCEIVEEVLAEFLAEFRAREIAFRTVYKACPRILIDRFRFKEALRNLIRNSIEAVSQNGEIKVALVSKGEFVDVIVGDSGVGMSKEELMKAGNPFYTTKAKGSGFGLFFVRKVVEALGGELILKSVKNRGTVVVMRIPYAKDRRC